MARLQMLIAVLLTSLWAPSLSWAQQFPNATSDPGYIYTPTYYPTAPSTLADCATYRNYTDATNLYFDTSDIMITRLNSCKFIAKIYQVTTDQLMEWNPSLSTNVSTCALQPGYSYCVLESEDSGEPKSSFFQNLPTFVPRFNQCCAL